MQHAARGSRAHTHNNSRMTLCRAFHFCRRILLIIIIISCSLRARHIVNGPVVRIQFSKYRNCACVCLVHQQVRNTKICAHLMSRDSGTPFLCSTKLFFFITHPSCSLFFSVTSALVLFLCTLYVPCNELWRGS